MVHEDVNFKIFCNEIAGIKKVPTFKDNSEDWRKPYLEENSEIYDQIMSEMRNKYGKNKKCREHS